MDHHDQHVLALVHAEEQGPEERSLGEVEGPARLGRGELVRAGHPLARGQAGEVPHRQLDLQRVQHCRDGKPVDHGERRAQRLVPADDARQRAGERRHVERPAESEGHRAVVDGTLGGELMQEPQALLGEGQRGGAGLGRESRDGAARARRRGPVQVRGQGGHGARHEHLHQRQIDRERRPDPRGELRRAQGVGAELEEIVVHTDVRDAKHVGSERDQAGLERRPRGGPRRGSTGGAQRVRERAALDLAGGPGGKGVEDVDGPRHLEGGEPLGHEAPQLLGAHAPAAPEDHRGGHVLAQRGMRHAERRGLRDRGMLGEGLVHLARRDLLAAPVDQLLEAPGDEHVAVGVAEPEVARAEPAIGVAGGDVVAA